MTIQEILNKGTPTEKKLLFSFSSTDSDEAVLLKFNLWARYFFPQYFSSPDAKFHKEIDQHNLEIYRGTINTFINIAFRGAGKTVRTKLFRAFVICNDREHFRRYLKILSEDGLNSKQIVTDIYNMLISHRVSQLYPEVFEKTEAKREETMTSFTTSTGIKIAASTLNMDQRGALQEESRPDEIWFEDFENRKTLRSARTTMSIAETMEEARTSLSKNGSCLYTCNYISEQGNVHALVMKQSSKKVLLIVPIIDAEGNPTWSRYTIADIEQMKQDDEDFEGERLCKPSARRDVFFDRESLEKQEKRLPVRTVAGFKIFYEFDPSHRYASGHDVGGGVQLDSSTSVFWDFDTIPARVVATFKSNTIKPNTFGDEIYREAEFYGNCLVAPERNYGDSTILRLRQLEANIYAPLPKDSKIDQSVSPKEYGWHTNALTKPKALFAFAKAIIDGLVALNDPDLIAEAMSYTRNDLIDTEKDPRLTTRHFDLLTAAWIGWQMKDHAYIPEKKDDYVFEEDKPLYPHIGV